MPPSQRTLDPGAHQNYGRMMLRNEAVKAVRGNFQVAVARCISFWLLMLAPQVQTRKKIPTRN